MKYKKSLIGLILASLSVLSVPVLAQGKYAVFSPKDAILGSNTAKSRFKILHKSKAYLAKKNRFESLKNQGQALVEKVSKDADVLSLSKKKEIQGQLKGKQGELAKLAEDVKKMEIEAGKKLLVEMRPRLERAVKQVVKAQKIDMLFDKSMVVHASPSHDITADVIKRLNQ